MEPFKKTLLVDDSKITAEEMDTLNKGIELLSEVDKRLYKLKHLVSIAPGILKDSVPLDVMFHEVEVAFTAYEGNKRQAMEETNKAGHRLASLGRAIWYGKHAILIGEQIREVVGTTCDFMAENLKKSGKGSDINGLAERSKISDLQNRVVKVVERLKILK